MFSQAPKKVTKCIFSGVLEEAKYFGIDELCPQLESLCAAFNEPADDAALSRRDVVEALMGTSSELREMRFQGVNLASD